MIPRLGEKDIHRPCNDVIEIELLSLDLAPAPQEFSPRTVADLVAETRLSYGGLLQVGEDCCPSKPVTSCASGGVAHPI